MSGAVPPLALYDFMACTWATLPLPFTYFCRHMEPLPQLHSITPRKNWIPDIFPLSILCVSLIEGFHVWGVKAQIFLRLLFINRISPCNSALATAWLCFELLQMTRYKQADFEEDDSSSVGSVQLTEGVSATTTHIRYHTVSAAQYVNSCKLYTWCWHFSWQLLHQITMKVNLCIVFIKLLLLLFE